MGLTRVDPTTVIDDDTGQSFYFPDTGEEEPAVPSVTRQAPGGLERYVPRQPPPEPQVDIGEAVIEPEPRVDVGTAQIESDGQFYNDTMPMTGRLPPGVGAGSGPYTGTPAGPDEIMARIAAATPDTRSAAPIDPYGDVPPSVRSQPSSAVPGGGGPRVQVDQPPYRLARSLDEIANGYGQVVGQQRRAADAAYGVKDAAAREEAAGEKDQALAAAEFAALQDKEMRAAEKAADDRWTAWKARYDAAANSEVNPERYWDSRNGYQKGIWLLSLAAHAWTQDKFGGKNMALQMLQTEIERDIAAQESNRNFKMGAVKGETEYLKGQDQRGDDALENRATAHALRLKSLERGLSARLKALGPAAERADYEGVLAKLAEDEVKVHADLYEKRRKEEMDKAELRIKQGQLALARSAAAKAKDAKAEKAAEVSGPNLDPRLGLTTVGPDGRVIPGGFALEKSYEQAGKVAQASASGNKEHAALLGLKKALADQSLVDKLRSSDANVRSEAVKLAYARARQLGGPGVLTDQDVATAMQTVTGQTGLGAWSYLMTPGDPAELVDKGIKTLKRRVTNEILGTGAIDVSRGRVEWNPQPLEDEDAGPRTPEDVRAEAAGAIGGETGIKPLRRIPLGDLPEPARSAVYASEKKSDRLPKLPRTPADEAVDSLVTAASSPTASLAEIDATIRQVETGKLDSERRARALMELRAVRAAAAARESDKMHRKELLRRGIVK